MKDIKNAESNTLKTKECNVSKNTKNTSITFNVKNNSIPELYKKFYAYGMQAVRKQPKQQTNRIMQTAAQLQ
jgi:hypothetical protein